LQNPDISKAKALQQAQLLLLNDRRYQHPGYWSPFLLIGNWL
jgi:CHAT domain-containing protein